jgi:S1-C subfamily serine protease
MRVPNQGMLRLPALLLLLVFLVPPAPGLAQITANVLQRTYQLRFGDHQGSGFTLDVDGHQYLITAKHLVDGIKDKSALFIRQGGRWDLLNVTRIPGIPDEVDIAVLLPGRQVSLPLPLEAHSDGILLGQELYFLGFPYDLADSAFALFDGSPVPFAKKGICAAFYRAHPDKPGSGILALDAINNPGFSGGPVLVQDAPNRLHVCAVVASYRYQPEPVFQHDKPTSDLTVHANTGIMFAYAIDYALEAIHRLNGHPSQ